MWFPILPFPAALVARSNLLRSPNYPLISQFILSILIFIETRDSSGIQIRKLIHHSTYNNRYLCLPAYPPARSHAQVHLRLPVYPSLLSAGPAIYSDASLFSTLSSMHHILTVMQFTQHYIANLIFNHTLIVGICMILFHCLKTSTSELQQMQDKPETQKMKLEDQMRPEIWHNMSFFNHSILVCDMASAVSKAVALSMPNLSLSMECKAICRGAKVEVEVFIIVFNAIGVSARLGRSSSFQDLR